MAEIERAWNLTRTGGRRDIDAVAWADLQEWVKAAVKLGITVTITIDHYGKTVGVAE